MGAALRFLPSIFLVDVWSRANYDFAEAGLAGVSRIIRIAWPGARRDKIARLAWRPRSDGASMWQVPNTFHLDSESGLRRSVAATELDRKTEPQMTSRALGNRKPTSNWAVGKGQEPAAIRKITHIQLGRDFVQMSRILIGRTHRLGNHLVSHYDGVIIPILFSIIMNGDMCTNK